MEDNSSQGLGNLAATASAPAPAPMPQEEMLPKSKVNDLVHERTREASQKAYEKGRTEALASYQQQPMQPMSAPAPQGMGGMQFQSEAQLKQMMENVFKQQFQTFNENARIEAEKQRHMDVATQIISKMNAAQEKYPDLVKRIDELAPYGELIPLINATEDSAGVIKDLIDNPLKLGQLTIVAQRSPQQALAQLQKLSASIKQNEAAKKAPTVNEPLSQISYSNVGMDSGTQMTVDDYRAQDWLRG